MRKQILTVKQLQKIIVAKAHGNEVEVEVEVEVI